MQVKQRKISIIIPVYNVEGYIGKCLESLSSQTFTDIEVLFIDDCSTDNSRELITSYINDYKGDILFRLICQPHNQGQSVARNRGIKEAQGEYVYMLDSDDYITDDCIELLYAEFQKDPMLQMVIGNYKIVGPLHLKPFLMQQRTYSSDEIITEQLRFNIYSMPWNKLIKKSFLIENGLFFQPGIVHEDNLWSFCSAFCFDKIAVVQKETYIYIVRPGSTERSHGHQWHQNQLFEVYKYLVKFIFKSDAPSKKDVKKNPLVYRFLENDMVPFIMDPLLKGDKSLSYKRYCEIRNLPFWSFSDVMFLKRLSIRRKWKFLHLVLPLDMGYKLYVKQHKKYKGNIDMTKNRITVITINYNNLSGLQRTIPSILSQTYTGYELIVIDGGSTDGSKEYLQTTDRINYWVSEPDKGVYNAMNKAVKMANNDYCIFMNSGDTFFSSQVLENVVGKLRDADFYSGCSTFIDGLNTLTWFPPRTLSLDFFLIDALNHQATFNRTAFLREHPYDESIKIVADWELTTRMFLQKECTYAPLDDMVSIYYLDGMSSTQKDKCDEERSKALKSIIASLPNGQEKKMYEQKFNLFEEKRLAAKKKSNVKVDIKTMTEREKRHLEKLRKKISYAMELPPVQRDLKILRNAFKMLLKDLF